MTPDQASPWSQRLGILERAAWIISMGALAVMGALVALSILGRWLFALPIPDDVLLAELLMVGVVVLPLARVQSLQGHIKIEVFTRKISPRTVQCLEFSGLVVGLFFFLLLSIGGAEALAEDVAGAHYYHGLLQIPSWPFRAMYLIGIGLITFRLLFDIISRTVGMIAGSPNPSSPI